MEHGDFVTATSDVAERPSDEEFARVLGEWATLQGAGRGVGDWDRAIEDVIRDERDLRARGFWVHGRDDIFGVLGIQRAEVRHSAMIAWLLDPCARHGFGSRFLLEFLALAFPDDSFPSHTAARTLCEVTREECRADIVIAMSDATIVVEAKVDAVESPRQCDILFERFAKDVGARFVFLTPGRRRPESATGDALRAFVAVSYSDVRTVLHAVLAATGTDHAPWGRRLAEDYLLTLRREFHEPR